MLLPLGAAGTATERLERAGLQVMPLGDKVQVAVVKFGSTAEKLGIEQGFDITPGRSRRPTGRPRNGCSCRRWRCWP